MPKKKFNNHKRTWNKFILEASQSNFGNAFDTNIFFFLLLLRCEKIMKIHLKPMKIVGLVENLCFFLAGVIYRRVIFSLLKKLGGRFHTPENTTIGHFYKAPDFIFVCLKSGLNNCNLEVFHKFYILVKVFSDEKIKFNRSSTYKLYLFVW